MRWRQVIAMVGLVGLLGCGEDSTAVSGTDTSDTSQADSSDVEEGEEELRSAPGEDGPDAEAGIISEGEPGKVGSESDAVNTGDTGDTGEREQENEEDTSTSASDCSEGKPCDDGDACTYGDQCAEDGTCSGIAYACEDDLDCTEEGQCAGDGSCTYAVKEGFCLIGGSCYEAGVNAPAGWCGVCTPEASSASWTWEEGPCDDEDPCTETEGTCVDALCVAAALSCDDGDVCTQDQCGKDGCIHEFVFAACDDGDACSLNDVCLEEVGCSGTEVLTCNDGNMCTADTCEDGCQFENLEGPCSDGDFCTLEDLCVDGECAGQTSAVCEDGNSCTQGVCVADKGCLFNVLDNPCCTGSKNICDDGDFCTLDTCELATGNCTNELFQGPCNDGDPCTFADTCFNGLCLGFAEECDDGNDCTLDSCSPGEGCVSEPDVGLSCNDGLECSTNDVCTDEGTCSGDTSECICTPEFSPTVSKLSSILVGEDGNPGSGLDLDNDTATCAPQTNCSEGVDNALSVLASFANAALEESVQQGDIIMLLEHVGYNGDGIPFQTNFYLGSPVGWNCDVVSEKCSYYVEPSGLDAACDSVVQIPGVIVEDGQLNGGGKGTEFPISIPLSADAILDVTLYDVQIAGQVIGSGGDFILEGVIGGAVKKTDLVAAVETLPEGSFPGGLSGEVILSLLDSLLVLDIDTDGDGVNEAISAGLPFIGIPGGIAGVAE